MAIELRGVEITPSIYKVAQFFVTTEELKSHGLLEGGPEVDLAFMREVVAIGEKEGWPKMTREDIPLLMQAAAGV